MNRQQNNKTPSTYCNLRYLYLVLSSSAEMRLL
ncbi:hypothetical protein T06_12288 [Trichinella sp. T6]|nr:hypothetical protein T06_12288 [Trichinella sp. T6]